MYYIRNFIYHLNKFDYHCVKDLSDETLGTLAKECFLKNINSSIIEILDTCKIISEQGDYCYMVTYKYNNYRTELSFMVYFQITDETHYIDSLLE